MKRTTIKCITIGAHRVVTDSSTITQHSLKDQLIAAVKRNAIGTEKSQVEIGNPRIINEIINRNAIYHTI
jgi:hypothetical protein